MEDVVALFIDAQRCEYVKLLACGEQSITLTYFEPPPPDATYTDKLIYYIQRSIPYPPLRLSMPERAEVERKYPRMKIFFQHQEQLAQQWIQPTTTNTSNGVTT